MINLNDLKLIDPEGGYELNGEKKWWTDLVYENAYEIVKDRKFPIVIPSYNSPNLIVLKSFLSRFTDEENYPIFILTRESQKSDYIEANKKHKFVQVISAPDEMIDSLGKTREFINQWAYDMKYYHVFMCDDDVRALCYTNRFVTEDGDKRSKYVKSGDCSPARIFAMWQLAVEKYEEKFGNLLISATYPVSFSWKAEYCTPNFSALLYRGNFNQIFCVNVKEAIEKDIHYHDNREVGHEDIDFLLQGLKNNCQVVTFGFLCYSVDAMDLGTFTEYGSTLLERMQTQQDLMKKTWGDYEYVKYIEKFGRSEVRADLRAYRKNNNITNYKLNIWNNGDMLT